MRKFLVRRAGFAIFTLIAATMIVFFISRLAGNPLLIYATPEGYGISQDRLDALSQKLGLNRPLVVQYVMWLGQAVRGDFGQTLQGGQPVTRVIRQHIGATLELAVAAWVFATVVGIPLGVLSAVKRASYLDYVARGFALIGQGAPPFWIGIMGILLFSVHLNWLPAGTRGLPNASVWVVFKHLIMPMVVLGWHAASGYLRLTRSAMLEVLDSEYVKLARSKGASEITVIWRHAFRNALIPPLTLSALLLAGFLNGAVVVEVVFGWPGIGQLATQAVFQNDFPTMTGIVLSFAALFAVASFVADILYVFIDPRIRFD